MLDYIFFDESLRDRFVEFARAKGIEVAISNDDVCIASIPEDLGAELDDAIDTYYELLLQENAELLEATEDRLEKNVAGVRVQLADGTPCTIRFDPDLLARMLQSISMEELRDVVQHIATSIQTPDDRPICHT